MLVAKQSKIQAGAILSDKGTLLDSDIKTAQSLINTFLQFLQPRTYLLYLYQNH